MRQYDIHLDCRRTASTPRRARRLPRLPSCRWLHRLRQFVSVHHAGQRAAADRGGVLGARTPEILRHSPRLGLADRAGSDGADRRTVRHREQRSRTGALSTAGRTHPIRPAAVGRVEAVLEASLKQISGKSVLAGAIRYALTRWTALLRYLADGRLELSNNAAERGMRAPFSVAKLTSSVAPMPVDNAPLVFTPSSKLQRCAASIRRPICPMFSDASRIIPSKKSTPCSPGFGQNSPAQASR